MFVTKLEKNIAQDDVFLVFLHISEFNLFQNQPHIYRQTGSWTNLIGIHLIKNPQAKIY